MSEKLNLLFVFHGASVKDPEDIYFDIDKDITIKRCQKPGKFTKIITDKLQIIDNKKVPKEIFEKLVNNECEMYQSINDIKPKPKPVLTRSDAISTQSYRNLKMYFGLVLVHKQPILHIYFLNNHIFLLLLYLHQSYFLQQASY